MRLPILAITRCLIICAEDYSAAINLPVKRRERPCTGLPHVHNPTVNGAANRNTNERAGVK